MKLRYFAWVRTRIGFSAEELSKPEEVERVTDLLAWLAGRGENYARALAQPEIVRVAVNQEFVGREHVINDSDEVALFPPVTGG